MRSGHAIWRLEGGLAVLHFIQCAGWALWVLPAGRWGGRLSGVWLHPGRYQRLRGLQGFFVCQGDAQGFLPPRRAVQRGGDRAGPGGERSPASWDLLDGEPRELVRLVRLTR